MATDPVVSNVRLPDSFCEEYPLPLVGGCGTTPTPPPAPTPTLPQVASATLLLDLEADTLILNDGDPVSTWADQSGNGHDFTQTGNSRPTKQTVGGYSAAVFDGVDDFMVATGFANNLSSLAVFIVSQAFNSGGTALFSKFSGDFDGAYWWVPDAGGQFYAQSDNSNYFNVTKVPPFADVKYVCSSEMINKTTGHSYVNGDNTDEAVLVAGTLGDYSNSADITLGLYPGFDIDVTNNVFAVLMYEITDVGNWATDRAAITAYLANRYGIAI